MITMSSIVFMLLTFYNSILYKYNLNILLYLHIYVSAKFMFFSFYLFNFLQCYLFREIKQEELFANCVICSCWSLFFYFVQFSIGWGHGTKFSCRVFSWVCAEEIKHTILTSQTAYYMWETMNTMLGYLLYVRTIFIISNVSSMCSNTRERKRKKKFIVSSFYLFSDYSDVIWVGCVLF